MLTVPLHRKLAGKPHGMCDIMNEQKTIRSFLTCFNHLSIRRRLLLCIHFRALRNNLQYNKQQNALKYYIQFYNMYMNQQDAQILVIRLYFPLDALHVSDYISPSSGATFISCTSHLV